MVKRFLPAIMFLLAAPLFAQEIDWTGSWQVYEVSLLSRYSLSEHTSGQSTVKIEDLELKDDGTVTTTLTKLAIQRWQTDEGFLMFETPTGNNFYYPRILGEDLYFLVRVDVLERNEELISITPKSLGNLILTRR